METRNSLVSAAPWRDGWRFSLFRAAFQPRTCCHRLAKIRLRFRGSSHHRLIRFKSSWFHPRRLKRVKIPGASPGAFEKTSANSFEPHAIYTKSRSADQAEASCFGVSDPQRMKRIEKEKTSYRPIMSVPYFDSLSST